MGVAPQPRSARSHTHRPRGAPRREGLPLHIDVRHEPARSTIFQLHPATLSCSLGQYYSHAYEMYLRAANETRNEIRKALHTYVSCVCMFHRAPSTCKSTVATAVGFQVGSRTGLGARALSQRRQGGGPRSAPPGCRRVLSPVSRVAGGAVSGLAPRTPSRQVVVLDLVLRGHLAKVSRADRLLARVGGRRAGEAAASRRRAGACGACGGGSPGRRGEVGGRHACRGEGQVASEQGDGVVDGGERAVRHGCGEPVCVLRCEGCEEPSG
mmetsp:Transcript_19657/g.65027  ORF Transcript_19657/g.65027 Transcript_19657/m.65027 type:complete len:268 (+) Transcript_19657:744-1547(+)